MTIRALLRLNSNVIDLCYDCRSGLRDAPPNGDLDIDTITDQLRELRDVLENLFKSATTPVGTTGSTSPALKLLNPSALVINELLSRCRNEMSEMETALKQESGRKRVRGPSSSLGSEVILGNLAVNTTALKGLMSGSRTYDADYLGFNLMLIVDTKVRRSKRCWRLWSFSHK